MGRLRTLFSAAGARLARRAGAASGRSVPGDGRRGHPPKDVRDRGAHRRAAGAPARFHHPRLPRCTCGAAPRPARYAYEGVVFRRHDPVRRSGWRQATRISAAPTGSPPMPRRWRLPSPASSAVAPGPLTVRLGDIGLFAALLTALGLPEPLAPAASPLASACPS